MLKLSLTTLHVEYKQYENHENSTLTREVSVFILGMITHFFPTTSQQDAWLYKLMIFFFPFFLDRLLKHFSFSDSLRAFNK